MIIQKFKSFLRGEAGVIAVMFAMAVPALVAAIGLSVDLGKAYLVRDRLSHALDAAGLAIANSTESEADIQDRLEQFMEANYPEEKIGEAYDITFEQSAETMKVSAKAEIDTSFMAMLGLPKVDVSSTSVIRRKVQGIEVSLVLDMTGSMGWGGKVNTMRRAAKDFVEVMFDRAEEPEDIRIALVPYSSSVRVGDIDPILLNNTYPTPWDPRDQNYAPYDPSNPAAWHGCLMARTHPYDTTDHHPDDAERWDIYRWPDTANTNNNDKNDWINDNNGNLQIDHKNAPNRDCEDLSVVPLNSDEDLLDNELDLYVNPNGFTNIAQGLVWGWRLISPGEPFTQGADYTDAKWRKNIILMTDGDNRRNPHFSPYGLGSGPNNNELDNRTEETCENLKAEGITLYAIIFGSPNPDTQNLFRDCASDENKFYLAPSNSELIDVYNKIANELANLHVSYE
jgi:Flp pilus assembly protein TadG